MILRSAFGLLLGGLAAFDAAQAQPYPPSHYPPANTQVYPPYRPLPGAAIPDDDDDDLPPHLRAAPGNYPPPPGGYVFPNDPRGQRVAPPMQREALPPQRDSAPVYGGRPPAVVYGDRTPEQPIRRPTRRPISRPPTAAARSAAASRKAMAPPRSPATRRTRPPIRTYGAPLRPPPLSGPGQSPMQLAPGQRPPATSRDVTGAVRPNTVATLPPEDQPEAGKAELPPHLKRQLVNFQSNEPAGTLVIDTANTYPLSRARQRAGDALRHRRRPRRLHLGGRGTRLAHGGVAGLASAGRDDRAPALSAALHGGRRRQSARRARALSRQDALPHPRHEPALDDRQIRVLGLYPPDQRRHRRISTAACRSAPASWCCRGRRPRRRRTSHRRSSSRCSSGKRAASLRYCEPCAEIRRGAIASTMKVTCSRSTGSGMVLQLLLQPDQHDAVHRREQRARQQRARVRRDAPARACAAAPRCRRTGAQVRHVPGRDLLALRQPVIEQRAPARRVRRRVVRVGEREMDSAWIAPPCGSASVAARDRERLLKLLERAARSRRRSGRRGRRRRCRSRRPRSRP